MVIEKVEHALECFHIAVDVADHRKARLSRRRTGGKQVLSIFGGKLSLTPDGFVRPAVGWGFTVLYGGPTRVGIGWHRGLDELGSSRAPTKALSPLREFRGDTGALTAGNPRLKKQFRAARILQGR